MLPTPSTSHIPGNVYEPAEDSFLLLDALSSPDECAFLATRFKTPAKSPSGHRTTAPLVVEIGSGSGVVLAFLAANADKLFGAGRDRFGILTLGIDVNTFACDATRTTVDRHVAEHSSRGNSVFLDAIVGDLTSPLRLQIADVLIFNPPYVPSESLPDFLTDTKCASGTNMLPISRKQVFERDGQLLALATDGGKDGMQVTIRVLEDLHNILDPKLGVAYVLLCAQNKPDKVKASLRSQLGTSWDIQTIRTSGKQGGWENLQIVRIARVIY